MAKTTTIELGDYFERFISRQIETGRFASDAEVLRAGLRLLEEEENKRQALRKAIADGERSGFEPVPFALDDFLDEMRSKQKPLS